MVDTLYADPNELRAYLQIKDTVDDDLLTLAVETASRWIDQECNRRFYADDLATNVADPALARTYFGTRCDLEIDDFDPATAITVKTGTTAGVFDTTLTSPANYLALPLNAGAQGKPQNLLRRVDSSFWPYPAHGVANVQVTARWGWPAVPQPIKQACLTAAADMFQLKNAPFGVAAANETYSIRVGPNRAVDQMLAPYKLGVLIG